MRWTRRRRRRSARGRHGAGTYSPSSGRRRHSRRPAAPPTPSTPNAPRTISCWSPARPSLRIRSTLCGRSSRAGAARATAAPASRSPRDASVVHAVCTANPSPPIATTTTLASRGPDIAISPAVVHPISGTPAARIRISLSNAGRSSDTEQKTMSSFASSPRRASSTARVPRPASSPRADPTPNQRAGWTGSSSMW